ncbi:hypothetical protein MNBD_NITROSPINAE02-1281 [hydrothermal vent metagenome]|uniref:Transporter n=1 Tax=hydrothermal vent metagenome TaxID=652676 RepID=A0A3B1BVK1_9ZZZZ
MFKRNLARLKLIFVSLLFCWSGEAFAHAPVFMMAPEAPGKGAFDLHTSLSSGGRGNTRETSADLEFTYGITRDFVVGFAVPFARRESFEEGEGERAVEGIDNPDMFLQWRFWDRDSLGAKHSSAVRLAGTAPAGVSDVARNEPTYMAGWAFGMESLKWYYTLDTRYQYNVEDDKGRPGDRFFADIAIGLRPHLGGLEDTDIVYFMELNYMNEKNSEFDGANNPDSGGEYMFISPEVLISPSNRLMIRTGAQIPVYQDINGIQGPKDITYKLVVELRY